MDSIVGWEHWATVWLDMWQYKR